MSRTENPGPGHLQMRNQFSGFQQGLYLNHAAMAPWPCCTSDAVKRFADENSTAGPAAYRNWIARENNLRDQLATLTGAASGDDIALLKNTTEGISLVASGINWQPGDNIVLPVGEFPSNRLPWLAQIDQGVTVREVDIRAAEDAEGALLEAMDENTRLLTVSAVQWSDGFRLDLARLGQACKSANVLFFVDAIQQLGALPMDVEACYIDFLAADAHKWLLGPEGIAVFYCRERFRSQLKLRQQGWHMYDQPWSFDTKGRQPSSTAKRFEAGSPNTLGQVALHASLELLLSAGMERVSTQVLRNSDFLINELGRVAGINIRSRTTPERRSGIVSFQRTGIPSPRLHSQLAKSGITTAVRGDSIRLSPHFYQDESDLAELLQALESFQSGGKTTF